MSMSDPIADMLTRVRNAVKARKATVEVPASRLKKDIAEILVKSRYVKKFVVVDDGKQGMMKILLNYTNGQPAILGIERVSTPGRRVYAGADVLPKVLNGLGCAIISTSQGVMTDIDARKLNVGGEVICKVW